MLKHLAVMILCLSWIVYLRDPVYNETDNSWVQKIIILKTDCRWNPSWIQGKDFHGTFWKIPLHNIAAWIDTDPKGEVKTCQ